MLQEIKQFYRYGQLVNTTTHEGTDAYKDLTRLLLQAKGFSRPSNIASVGVHFPQISKFDDCYYCIEIVVKYRNTNILKLVYQFRGCDLEVIL